MLILVLAAIGCFAMTLAPVTWVVISEILPNHIRGAAMAVAAGRIVVGFICADLHVSNTERPDWHFGHILSVRIHMHCGFCFCDAKFSETKGRTLEELEQSVLTSHASKRSK